MGKRFKELRGRVSEEAPVNSVGTGEAVSTNVPVVRKPLKILKRKMPQKIRV
jgi:hypothetical protein